MLCGGLCVVGEGLAEGDGDSVFTNVGSVFTGGVTRLGRLEGIVEACARCGGS